MISWPGFSRSLLFALLVCLASCGIGTPAGDGALRVDDVPDANSERPSGPPETNGDGGQIPGQGDAGQPPSDAGVNNDGGGVPQDAGPVVGIADRPVNSTCLAGPRPAPAAPRRAALEPAFPNLGAFSRPILALQAPGVPDYFYIVEQPGRVRRFLLEQGVTDSSLVLDISQRVDDGPNEAGLLGLAFHPNFATNGEVYVSYTASVEGQLTSRVSRFRSLDAGQTIAENSEEILLSVAQPFGNHNGGHIAFGADNFLYVGLGDGGSGGDPLGSGQNPNTLLGSVLRIDIDAAAGYDIPADNPFATRAGGAPETFAFGFRNPWRFSFDRLTGELWLGDVGQNQLEEVDIVQLGGNYGWNTKEGRSCYANNVCDERGLIDPVAEYGHDQGESITGGFVYRGASIPELFGAYLYADFGSGRVWELRPDPGSGEYQSQVLLNSNLGVASFAEDQQGELYVVDLFGGGLHKFVPGGPPVVDPTAFPQLLSETGCFQAADPKMPLPALIPYEVNAPFWSDGLEKKRYFAIPDGTKISVTPEGDFDFPAGTVTVKEFRSAGVLVETRLFVRHDEGAWVGYSYEWNQAQTEATLLASSKRVAIAGGQQSWLIPSSGQCLQCHTDAAGRSLGLELAQLARDVVYPNGVMASQLETLERIELFEEPLPAVIESLARYFDDTRTADARARAYLHSNCSHCHRADGPQSGFDLRAFRALPEMSVCDVLPEKGDLGVEDGALIRPGSPSTSIIPLRMRALNANRMPRIGSEQTDQSGISLVETWIQEIAACP